MTVRIEEVARNTYLIDCGKEPTFSLPQVAYLLYDDPPVLIDPGSTSSASALLADASSLGFDLRELAYIIPTHIHLDHGGGAGYLTEHLPKAKVVLHPRATPHMVDPSIMVRSARLVFGDNFEKMLGPVMPVPEQRIHTAQDGEVIRLGNRDLRIVFSPGHAVHHIAIEDSLTGGLFCGDALGFITEDMPDTPFPVGLSPFNPEAYLETVDRLAALSPEIIFYAHHRARTEVKELIGRLRGITITLGEIIRGAIEAGTEEAGVFELVLEYARRFSTGSDLPIIVEVGISGYVDYYRNRK